MSTPSTRERLLTCFQAVFPAAAPDSLAEASIESVPTWDSVAHVTLIGVIEEEFAAELPPDSYGDLTSFQAFLQAIESLGG